MNKVWRIILWHRKKFWIEHCIRKSKQWTGKNMEAFLNEMYAVGAESVNVVNVDVDALRTDIGKVKGIGESRLNEIMDIINKHLTTE